MCSESIQYVIRQRTGFVHYFLDGLSEGKSHFHPKLFYALRYPTAEAARRVVRQIENPYPVVPLDVVRVSGDRMLPGQ